MHNTVSLERILLCQGCENKGLILYFPSPGALKKISFPKQFLMVIFPPHGRENGTVGTGKGQPFFGPCGWKMYERLEKCCPFSQFHMSSCGGK
jgi:hypothetical protein